MAFVAYPSTPDFPKFRKSMTTVYVPPEGKEHLVEDETDMQPKPTKGTFIGTVKLHGTNASIIVRNSSNPEIQYQSRNRVISVAPKEDNLGTAAFFSRLPLSDLLAEILRIRGTATFDEVFIAGEWAGTGIQKGVAIASLARFFAIFNIRIDGHWVDIREYKSVHSPERRVFNVANFRSFEIDIDLKNDDESQKAFEMMKQYTLDVAKACPVGDALLQEPGAMPILKKGDTHVLDGEGIVWTMIPTPDHDTTLYNFKTKAEQFATVNASAAKASGSSGDAAADKVVAFVDFALGERRLEQGIEYLQELGKDPDEMKSVGDYMKWVVGDVMKEEGWRLEEKDTSGQTLVAQGVTENKVKKLVGERARIWFTERRNKAGRA